MSTISNAPGGAGSSAEGTGTGSAGPSGTAARTSAGKIAVGLVIAIVVATAVNFVVATLALAVGASSDFQPLKLPAYAFFGTIGILVGAAGWALIRRLSANPGRLLRWLVPAVVAVSLVPDLALLGADPANVPGVNGIGVVALMVMHVVVAAVAVPVYARVLPLPAGREE